MTPKSWKLLKASISIILAIGAFITMAPHFWEINVALFLTGLVATAFWVFVEICNFLEFLKK
jgi:hypothetical protein